MSRRAADSLLKRKNRRRKKQKKYLPILFDNRKKICYHNKYHK
jgi:hypothetical protein